MWKETEAKTKKNRSYKNSVAVPRIEVSPEQKCQLNVCKSIRNLFCIFFIQSRRRSIDINQLLKKIVWQHVCLVHSIGDKQPPKVRKETIFFVFKSVVKITQKSAQNNPLKYDPHCVRWRKSKSERIFLTGRLSSKCKAMSTLSLNQFFSRNFVSYKY